MLFHTWLLRIHFPSVHFHWKVAHFQSAEQQTKWSPSVLRVNTFIVTVFVSLHVSTAFVFLITFIHPPFFITFTHLESQFFYWLISSVTFNVTVTSAHIHRHSTHRHYHFHWSSFLPFTLLPPPLPFNMPVRGLYGHGKGSYGHGLAHTLPVPALCGHGKGVSALTGLLFCFFVLLMKDLMGSHSYCHDVTLKKNSSVHIFQHTVTRLLLNLENTSHFFSKGTIFL